MSLAPSLRSRVKRLEVAEGFRGERTFGERLREAEARIESETTEQRAEREAKDRADCIAALSESDARESFTARLQRARRRLGREYLREAQRATVAGEHSDSSIDPSVSSREHLREVQR